MNSLQDRLRDELEKRKKEGNFRQLTKTTDKLVDFVSNDYLGLARSQTLYELILLRSKEIEGMPLNGSGGSRLLAGNSSFNEEVESFLANVFQAEGALIFNSGYQANLGLLSAIPKKGDTIIYDQLSHVCLKEGAWLSKAQTIAFAHNDLTDLERKLTYAEGEKFIVIESVYSMDGDFAPIEEIIELTKKYGAHLIVDEAHSTGVFGEAGGGLLEEKGLANDVFARVYTFGKAMGIHGACVAGSNTLKEYLINFGRPFIYTTSLPLHSLVAIEQSFKFLSKHSHLKEELISNIHYFREQANGLDLSSFGVKFMNSNTSIQPILITGNKLVKDISAFFRQAGFDVRPVLSPTVKRGEERIRVCLHSFNTKDEMDEFFKLLKDYFSEHN